MKKFFLTAIIAVSIISSSFAGSVTVSHLVKSNFESEFGHITNVEWSAVGSFTSATFNLNNKKTQAFYDKAGNLVGSAHSIDIAALPTYAKRQLAKNFASYTIKEAIEFVKPDESAYFVSVENEGKSIILMIADGQVSRYK
jgi:hypothetical protein